AAGEGRGPEPARGRLRGAVRPERLVLRVGGRRPARPRHPRTVIEQHFGESPPFSLGVEEEVMILDGETLMPVAAVDVLVRGAEGLDLPGTLKTELHASVVELNTQVCATAHEALEALEELRAAADGIARENGLRIAAAGAHPLARPEDLPVVRETR